MGRRKTHEEFVTEVREKYHDEYDVLSNYVNNQTSISLKHTVCGHIREIKPSTVLFKNIKCPNCEMLVTRKKFMKEFQQLAKGEYIITGEFKGLSTKASIKHVKCGYEYGIFPTKFIRGNRCAKCAGRIKKTTGEFKQEVFDLVGAEYEVLGEYEGIENKIKLKHNICGKIYKTTPHGFLRGNRCKYCFGREKSTTTEFKEKVFELYGNDYEVLSEYTLSKNPIKLRHKCGYEFETTPNKILSGYGCTYCNNYYRSTEHFRKEVFEKSDGEFELISEFKGVHDNCTFKHLSCNREFEYKPVNFIASGYKRCPLCKPRKKRTHEDFKKEFDSISNGNYELIDVFETLNKKVEVKHTKCGKTFHISPDKFLQGRGCPHCFKSVKKTTDQFKQEVNEATSGEYTVLSNYKNSYTKILMRHNKCGYEWKVVPNQFLHSNSRCPMCSSTARKTQEKFEKEVFDLVGDEYLVLGKYINSSEHIKMKHNKCGHIWNATPSAFLNGTGCPVCAESKGEKRIRRWLTNHKINFIAQHKYQDLIGTGGGLLSYDFFLPNQNLLIEYQGQFHDGKRNKYVRENLETQKEHDRRKREYAEKHGIKLLEIWYWDFDNIETILEKEMSNLIPQPTQ